MFGTITYETTPKYLVNITVWRGVPPYHLRLRGIRTLQNTTPVIVIVGVFVFCFISSRVRVFRILVVMKFRCPSCVFCVFQAADLTQLHPRTTIGVTFWIHVYRRVSWTIFFEHRVFIEKCDGERNLDLMSRGFSCTSFLLAFKTFGKILLSFSEGKYPIIRRNEKF